MSKTCLPVHLYSVSGYESEDDDSGTGTGTGLYRRGAGRETPDVPRGAGLSPFAAGRGGRGLGSGGGNLEKAENGTHLFGYSVPFLVFALPYFLSAKPI